MMSQGPRSFLPKRKSTKNNFILVMMISHVPLYYGEGIFILFSPLDLSSSIVYDLGAG